MHFLSLRYLKDKRGQKADQQVQQMPMGSQTLLENGNSNHLAVHQKALCVPSVSGVASVEVGGKGDVERAQPPAPAGPCPCSNTDGLVLMLDPGSGDTGEKAQVTADNHQKITQKALKHINQQPVYNGLTFSVTAAQVQQLSRQLGLCYGPRKHWAGICNPLARLLVKRHLEEGACLPLCVVRIKHLALSACHSAAQR